MKRILLVRHGQTAWNAQGRVQGHTDIELDDTGRAQARDVAAGLAGTRVDAVWTSDLSRARQTGEIIAAALGLAVPQIDPALRERSLGAFEGLTREECQTRHPEAWAAWYSSTGTPPGGESREVALARMATALHRIAREPGTTLVVSHGGVMRLMLLELGDPVLPIHNGAIHALDHDGERFRRA